MTTLIIGGTGFIGRRLIPLLAKQGEDSVVMDINPQTANFSELAKVRVLRGDVSQFDDVMAVMTTVKPDRVINLAYYISSDLPPRVASIASMSGPIRSISICARPGSPHFSMAQRQLCRARRTTKFKSCPSRCDYAAPGERSGC
jgi:nucleoside-diphosphate-sugar epimerase